MKHALTVLFVATLALSGCLSDDAPDEGTIDENDADAAPVADRIGVVFHTGTYEAAPGVPAVFDVEVPENAQNVRFEISTSAVPGSASATVGLGGCGSADVQWGGDGNVQIGIGSSSKEGDLCESGEAGMQTLTVEAAAVPLSGTLTVRADLPSE